MKLQNYKCKEVNTPVSKNCLLLLNLRYRPHYSKYNDLYYTQQNHSSVKLFTLCIHDCLMNLHTKFYPRTVSQS